MLALVAFCAPAIAPADAIDAVQTLREGGCGGLLAAAHRLHHDARLDRAASRWAAGASLQEAVGQSGYTALKTRALHVSGPDASLMQQLRASNCQELADPALADIGLYQRGADKWLILAAAFELPARAQTPVLAARVLNLVNEARAHGAQCGTHTFGPASPLSLSAALADVALGHATDMAQHGYFEHTDLTGHTPADRVRAIGYQEKLVGENIAYGPTTADEVVKGWLASPGHCENILDPHFAQMGVAFAAGGTAKPGLYWVQVLAAPRG